MQDVLYKLAFTSWAIWGCIVERNRKMAKKRARDNPLTHGSVHLVVLGGVRHGLEPLLCTSLGMALVKADSRLRPAEIPTVWNRLVGKSATAAHRQRLNALMAPPGARFIQFACMRDGARRCARMIEALLASSPEICVVVVDVRNAHTAIDRTAVRLCERVKAARVSKKAFEARRAALKRAVEEVAISSKAQLLLEQLQSMLQSPSFSPQISRI